MGLKIIDGTPTEISKYIREEELTEECKELRKQCWEKLMKKAGGDYKKAMEILDEI